MMERRHERVHERCGCASAGAAGPFVLAGVERQYERPRPFAIRHLFLDLSLDFDDKSVAGTATLEFERVAPDTGSLELDAVGFELEGVRVDLGRGLEPAGYDYDGERIEVHGLERRTLGKVEISYRARPRRGLYFLEPDKKVKHRPRQVWSQCQDEDARHWFPCHDKPHVKMTTELRVVVPQGMTALSNGKLVASKTEKKRGQPWSYHFLLEQPHPSYLVTLVAGEFAVVEDRPARVGEREIPVRYYVPRDRAREARRSFGETPRMIELFSRLTGLDFPWDSYSQIVVSDFIFGGMENTTASTMYEHVLLDERAALDVSSNDLVAHELAHQWFGDFVTCRDWSHAWLNEGFATFFEHVEREDRLGRDEYDYSLAADLDAYLAEASSRYTRPIVCRDYAAPIDLFDRHLYEKGGLVLHMLRRELGDELFWRAISLYLSSHRHAIVETNDLLRSFERVSGRSFERFFDQWVFRPGHPELRVKVGYDKGVLAVDLKQTQKTPDQAVFSFDFEIEVGHTDGRTTRHKKSVKQAEDTLVVELGQRPAWVGVDPEFRVAARVQLEAPSDMLRGQLAHSSSARLRWLAAEALGKRDDPPTISALARALGKKSEAWMVRAEAARALGRIRADAARAELEKQAKVEHPKVRRAVAAALGNFKHAAAARTLGELARRDRSYLVSAEAARALGRTRQPGVLEMLAQILDRPSWADVTRAGALDGLGALREKAAVPLVLERSRYGVPSRGRRAAVHALAELDDSRTVREHLEELLEDPDPHLKIEAVSALQALGDVRSRGPLRRALEGELDGRVARRIREALRDLGGAGAAERKRLSDELEQLRGELTELKARLSKVEQTRHKPRPKSTSAPSRKAVPKTRKRKP
jgi:aminopeptidase N